MENKKIKPMMEGGVLSAIAVLMALISVYVPLLGIAVVFVLPLPVIILVVRHGFKWGVMLSFVAAVIIGLLIHPIHALRTFVAFGFVGLVFGYTYRKGYSAFNSLCAGIFSSIVSMLLVVMMSIFFLNINPLNFDTTLGDTLPKAIEMYRAAGMNEKALTEMEQDVRQSIEMAKMLTPMIVAFGGIAIAFVNFVFAGKVLRKLGHTDIVSLKPFVEWRMPLWVAYLYGFALVGLYWGSTRDITMLTQASINANFLATMLGFVQGMTLIVFLMERYHLSKVVRWLILILVMTNGFFLQIIGFVGLFDIVFDYRRRLGWNK